MGEERFRYKKHVDREPTGTEEASDPTTDSMHHEEGEADTHTEEPQERFRYSKSTTSEGATANPERFRYRKHSTDEDTEPTEDRFRYRKSTIGNQSSTSDEHPRTRTEVFHVQGERVVSKITQILREGNALSITLQDPYGNVIFEVPMSVGVGVTVLFPSVSALVLIGTLWTNLKVVVERRV